MSDKDKKLDPRVEFIEDRVSTSLKIKGDKLARIHTDEACKFCLFFFSIILLLFKFLLLI
jgi:hypothetical protein